MQKLNIPEWVQEQRRQKWRWAGKMMRSTDEKWSKKVLDYTPDSRRPRGHPKARWTEALDEICRKVLGEERQCQGIWSTMAQQEETWNLLENDFLNYRCS